ncbi:MAG: D-sedoheptulose 7-phosphate isomerase [Acidobacteria bacterium]|nr:D-sedoheptulose 7-phosphate isomerase [Acidobacteriota bacterium]
MKSDIMRAIILETAEASVAAKRRFFADRLDEVERVARLLVDRLRDGGKILLFGNGGSAADAQHLAAELVNRFTAQRPALAAISLTTDTSILTSIANDADFESVFSRQVEALGRPGDVVVAISTSGNSPNILAGLLAARERGMSTVALLGRDGGRAQALADLALVVESAHTARIQEVHITLGHILCDLIEREFAALPEP